jgi:26S proteasome regulatory subunit N9
MMGTTVGWMCFLLQAFNVGDLAKYLELCHNYRVVLTTQFALVENEKILGIRGVDFQVNMFMKKQLHVW